MDGRNGADIRDSMLDAITNLISSNEKSYSYDKTYIGRISAVLGNNKYDVVINGKKYTKIPSTSLLSFNKNEVVYCLAPQGNLNQLRIMTPLKSDMNIITELASKEKVVSKGNYYVKYESGLIVQWGTINWTRTNGIHKQWILFPITFGSYNYSVSTTIIDDVADVDTDSSAHIVCTAMMRQALDGCYFGAYPYDSNSYSSGIYYIAIGY